ncbi:inositol diphosphatase DSP4-like [Rutidosis leptorrhynchoides]|uniref:inositol diphosphatase DSP4-like n=1 Tax=Rutidosis leptorrhynchoides TaxID=125765 RepID=UPI003A99978A
MKAESSTPAPMVFHSIVRSVDGDDQSSIEIQKNDHLLQQQLLHIDHPHAPVNFGVVDDHHKIFRSGFPNITNLSFLKSLGIFSIIYLCPEPYPQENLDFINANAIKLHQFGIQKAKDRNPCKDMQEERIRGALNVLIDPKNYPLLIHCKHGKHRTGCLVGCFRKVQRWGLCTIVAEYKKFAGNKSRLTDQIFLEMFDTSGLALPVSFLEQKS